MESQPVPPLSASLRAAREALGLPQALVANAADLDPSHYAKIERGRSVPTLATLYRLACVLDLSELADALRPCIAEAVDA